MRTELQNSLRMLVRTREDFQAMRKRLDNRIGRKADGSNQNINDSRCILVEDVAVIKYFSDEARRMEKEVEKQLLAHLKRFPVYDIFLQRVKGVGTIAAAWLLGEFDIEEATTVSKMWQYAGFNPGMVRGKKAIKKKDYKPEMGEIVGSLPNAVDGSERVAVLTDTLIRGDCMTEGFLSPYNKPLRTALVGVMADGFIKQQNTYCLEFYYPYKLRLEQSDQKVLHLKKMVPWKEVSKGHRDRAAKRKMVKEFLKDLYAEWRAVEGLPVRKPYAEEYLGKKHAA